MAIPGVFQDPVGLSSQVAAATGEAIGVASCAATWTTPGTHNAAANVASTAALRVTPIDRPLPYSLTSPSHAVLPDPGEAGPYALQRREIKNGSMRHVPADS